MYNATLYLTSNFLHLNFLQCSAERLFDYLSPRLFRDRRMDPRYWEHSQRYLDYYFLYLNRHVRQAQEFSSCFLSSL